MTTSHVQSTRPAGLRACLALASLLGLSGLVPACSFGGPAMLCCTNADEVTYEDPRAVGQYAVAKTTARELTAVAQRSFDEVVTACRNIATDLDSPPPDDARWMSGRDAAEGWCDLASRAITGQIKAKGSFRVTIAPPRCRASVAARASCQALCTTGGRCETSTSPPRCTGGKLQIACRGTCSARGGAEVGCEGTCEGTCQGSCTTTEGVACNGACDGVCEATASGGREANGVCKGTCKGTCSSVAPGATCKGSCEGTCRGACKGTGTVAVRCDGACDGPSELLACEGGKLEGGCAADPKCDANCDARAAAALECSLPEVSLEVGKGVEPKHVRSLRENLPRLALNAQGRGEALVTVIANVTRTLAASVSSEALDTEGIACLNQLGAQTADSLTTMQASVRASSEVLTGLRP